MFYFSKVTEYFYEWETVKYIIIVCLLIQLNEHCNRLDSDNWSNTDFQN